MLILDSGSDRFQVRAGALIFQQDHLLVHRACTDTYWSLPGGRVEFHESAAEALAREMQEELGQSATVGPLHFIIENFFSLAGRRTHELGFYFSAHLSAPLPFDAHEIIHRVRDGETDLEFRWVRPAPETLKALDFKPALLQSRLAALPTEPLHLTHRD